MDDSVHSGDDRVPLGRYVTEKWPVMTHASPVRLMVPHLYAWKSAKRLNGIELRSEETRGSWEQAGYHVYGDPWTEQRFSSQEIRQAYQIRRRPKIWVSFGGQDPTTE